MEEIPIPVIRSGAVSRQRSALAWLSPPCPFLASLLYSRCATHVAHRAEEHWCPLRVFRVAGRATVSGIRVVCMRYKAVRPGWRLGIFHNGQREEPGWRIWRDRSRFEQHLHRLVAQG